ncbi:MAG: FAD-dependent oxidoreductase [Deltaproteobacteria bacterium]|nr:FAD-dependent oxidoreductase [Deltaproteobacteria bacterium]
MTTDAKRGLLDEPIEIGPIRLANRVMMSVHGPRLSQTRYLPYLAERAAGGVGLIGVPAGMGVGELPLGPGRARLDMQGDFDAVPFDPLSKEGLEHLDRTLIPTFAAQAKAVHEFGCRLVGQLYHPGTSRNHDDLQPAVGPSEEPDDEKRQTPHVLSLAEIERVERAYVEGARRIAAAGLDAVELHAAHGYLFQQFLSPATNFRKDAYGGDLEGRCRLLEEVVERVLAQIGPGVALGVRLTGIEPPGGYGIDEIVRVAKRLEARGVAYLNVSGGTYTGNRRGLTGAYVGSIYEPETPHAEAAAAIRRAVSIPVIVSGRIPDLEVGERLVAAGIADLVGLVRALIAEPRLVEKTRAARTRRVEDEPRATEPIAPTLGCNECHFTARAVVCATNPAAGKERELALLPTERPRRILVVGAGPAGVEAAWRAAARGHEVLLCERSDRVGGMVSLLGLDPHRPQYARYADYLRRRLDWAGVELRLETEVDLACVDAAAAEVVVLATGAEEYVPGLPGVAGPRDAPSIHTATAVLRGASLGPRVLVVAGTDDQVGSLATADLLAARGHAVTLIAEAFSIGEGLEKATRYALVRRLLVRGVDLRSLTKLVALADHSAQVVQVWTGASDTILADSLVFACGARARAGLARALESRVLAGRAVGAVGGEGREGREVEIHSIGDCLAPRRILHATHDGARLAEML